MHRSLLAPFLLLPLSLNAQARHTPPSVAAKDTSFPVTHVSLYKNGVGFFEHTGHVTGNASVTIDFTSSQLNDVLQSLTALDLNGGRISGAGYNSTTPLEQQLKTLPLNLDSNPNASDFYAAIRGSRVEVHSPGASISGRLLSVEVRSTEAKGDDSKTIDRYFLTVVADSGEVRTLELTPTTSVRLIDTSLHNDVSRYLQLLDANRSQGLRHLTLEDHGTGTRELRVSYISEVPIWKSTYRILTTQGSPTATLQGWSVVDNTTGTDWNNVQLSLIAGAPQSFIQPLSQPIYSRRNEIPIAQEAQLTPQTFDSSMDSTISQEQVQDLPIDGRNITNLAAVLPGVVAPKAARAASSHGYANAGVAGMSGMAGGVPGGIMGGMAGGTGSGPVTHVASAPSVSYEDAAEASIAPTTKTAGFDDFFAYNLTEPVTIRKNESALVPILQTKLPADPVTLVTSNGFNLSQPLRALWITNNSDLTLDRGSFSVVENGSFGGEGLLDPIHPGEKRLLSYAADQAVHVTTEAASTHNERVAHITAAKGMVIFHRGEVREVTYVVHNSATTPRTVVLEHPVDQRFKLTSDIKPDETTATVYRFRLNAAPGATIKLPVSQLHRGVVSYHLLNASDDQIALILREGHDDPKLAAALAPIIEARTHAAEAQIAVDQTQSRLKSLHDDEERQRANITALANADKSSRDRFVHDLNTTEDNITAAQTELKTRQATLDAARAELRNRIEALSLDDHF